MKVYAVWDSTEEKFAGPISNPKLAHIIHDFFSFAVDEDSELVTLETDEYGEQFLAGKKPWEICVTYSLRTGKVMETDAHPIWPPEKNEGLVENREGFRRYFFWAKTKGEAITQIGRVKVPPLDHETELSKMKERLSESELEEEEEAY